MTLPVHFALKGFAIGFSIAAPVGPIGILCIRRSLADGRAAGLATGLGAATADACYGAIAAFGLSRISQFLVGHRQPLSLLGGLFLCYLAVRTWFSVSNGPSLPESPVPVAPVDPTPLLPAYTSTVFLTLTNPMTLLSFIAIFAGLGLAAAHTTATAASLVAGVFLGSGTWWLALSTGISALSGRLESRWIAGANRVSAATLLAFGLYATSTAIF